MPLPRSRKRSSSQRQPANSAQHTDAAAVRAAAIALLARRDFASAELRAKLRSQGFDEGVAGEVITELAARGVLDDRRFAENYVNWHAGRGQGPIRIAADLRRLGLPEGLIDAALASGPDWPALARRARTAKFGRQPPASWADKARQARFLQYRGFSSDHIRAATGADPDLD
jgi:regulatory protein